jgi:hypothetical protein
MALEIIVDTTRVEPCRRFQSTGGNTAHLPITNGRIEVLLDSSDELFAVIIHLI